MTDLEDRKPDAEAPVPDDIKACVGATGGGDGAALGSALPPEEVERLKSDIVSALKTVFDPEIPVDIYELGLIYRIDIDGDRNVDLDMTSDRPWLPRRRRYAALGGKRGFRRARRGPGQGQPCLRSALGNEPHER